MTREQMWKFKQTDNGHLKSHKRASVQNSHRAMEPAPEMPSSKSPAPQRPGMERKSSSKVRKGEGGRWAGMREKKIREASVMVLLTPTVLFPTHVSQRLTVTVDDEDNRGSSR